MEHAHEIGLRVIEREGEALRGLAARWPQMAVSFDAAVEAILGCKGRVILCGMGKSGQLGRKIASTLISTGTPASFLHPAEGFHGDVGLVTSSDLVLAISNSGATGELIELVPTIRNLGATVIALTGPEQSPLARLSDVVLAWGDHREADSTGLVPTVSAALTLALGDALTIATMERRGFGAGDYHVFHPKGAIGSKLALRVIDLLRGPRTNPTVSETSRFGDALEVMTRHTLGGVSVIDGEGRLCGIVTDGDVRRMMLVAKGSVGELLAQPTAELMTRDPATTSPETLALEALRQMEEHKPSPIGLLPVVDADRAVVGMLHLHTLVQAGLKSADEGTTPAEE